MVAARQTRLTEIVREELAATEGAWTAAATEADQNRLFEQAVSAEVSVRSAAMAPTEIQLNIPVGGGVVATNMPLGTIAIPPDMMPDTSDVNHPLIEPGIVTILDTEAGAETAAMLENGSTPSSSTIDAQSSTYVLTLASGARLFVISDQRTDEIARLRPQLEAALRILGQPATLEIFDMTHHLQRGWISRSGMIRARQLAKVTRLLADLAAQSDAGARALVVSVHGDPDDVTASNYIDPASRWIFEALGFSVIAATGGNSPLVAARDVSLLEVALGEDEAVRGIVGGAPSLGLRPDRPLLLQAHAYERQLEAALTELRSELSEELTSEERTQLNTQVAELQTAYAPLRPAIEAYLTALEGSIGRSIKGPRPAIAPPTDGPEPAAAEADALRELLTDAPIMTTDAVRLSASALVLIGQEAHASLDADARELLAARFEVRATAGRLRAWSSQEDVRRAIDALQRYKTALLRSQASASAGSRALFTTEVGRVHQDLSTVTGLSTQDLAGLTEAIALADRVQSHALSPLLLYSVHDLVNPYIRQQAQTNNGGLVALDRRLYRLTGSRDSVTASMVPLNKLSVPRPQQPPPSENTHAGPASVRLVSGAMRNASAPPVGEATLLPFAAPATGNIINFSGRTIEFTNRTVAPTPSGPLSSAVPGDYVIRGASSAWIVAAHPGGPPIAGASIGGEWWRVEANGTWTLEVDAAGGVRREESERRYGGRRGPGGTYGTRLPKSMTEGPNDGSSRGPKAVRGALAIIMIANEIMGQVARARQQQRYNLEMARAQLQFWTIAGANPRWQMRTGAHNEVRSPDTEATTSVFGDTVYHFITDIDVDALQRNLPTVAQNYQQLRLWIDMGEQLRAILVEPPMPKEPTAKD
ncbi:MAG: hypothetical protein AAFV29_04070, partial [Myxococcota bacterium]